MPAPKPARDTADKVVVEETEAERLDRKQAPSRVVKPTPDAA